MYIDKMIVIWYNKYILSHLTVARPIAYTSTGPCLLNVLQKMKLYNLV